MEFTERESNAEMIPIESFCEVPFGAVASNLVEFIGSTRYSARAW